MDYRFNSGWDIPDEVDEMIRENKEDIMVKNNMNNANEAMIVVANNDAVSRKENNMNINNIKEALNNGKANTEGYLNKNDLYKVMVDLDKAGVKAPEYFYQISEKRYIKTNTREDMVKNIKSMISEYEAVLAKKVTVVVDNKEENTMANAQNISVAVVANEQVTAIPVPVPVAVAETVTATPVVVESTENRIVTRIDENTVNIAYPKGVEIKTEGCNPNRPMTVTVEKPAPKRVVDYSAMSPKEKTEGVIREVRAIAANNKKKGYGTNITAFMLTAIICKYLGIPNLKKGLAEGAVTDEIKANANKVRDYLINKGIIRIAVIQDAANFRFYDPSIYDGSVKGLYDATKYQKTGVCKPVSYKVF